VFLFVMAFSLLNETIRGPSSALLKGEPAAGLPQRCAFLALLFAAELLAATTWLDTSTLNRSGLAGWVGDYGARALHALVTFGAIFVTLGYLKTKSIVGRIFDAEPHPPNWKFLASHFGLMSGFAALSAQLFRHSSRGFGADTLAATWMAAGILGIAAAVFAVFPPKLCLTLLSSTGYVWVPSAVAGILASLAGSLANALWKPAVAATFRLVGMLLSLCTSHVIADAATATIGTPTFNVTISAQCSGLEGAGLMLVFGTVWLWLFRQNYRFPQALLLIPAGVTVLWLLNAVRIAALILIGNAGAPGVALGGFHSQAGWIAFNAVALGLSLAAPRLPWVTRSAPRPRSVDSREENPSAAYLVPFLVILAAAMISRATAAGFEWLYGLRFLAAGSALWFFRRKYADLNWRFGWLAPAIGGLVFAGWLAMDRFAGVHPDNGIASGLAAISPFARTLWLGLRVLGAVVTVPIAEELAFRGFLIRRLIGADFESFSPQRFTIIAIVVSSIAFGLLHGGQWLAATGAGILYAAVYLRRGRIGDAVVAHATTNALIAVTVLTRGQWHLW
jgi:exosortase E/protease (VPEID-CTERM system)